MENYQKFLDAIKNPSTNIKEMIDELLEGASSPQDIIDRWNDFTRSASGSDQFQWIDHKGKKYYMQIFLEVQ